MRCSSLFPTSVGVYRKGSFSLPTHNTIPHERGGVPLMKLIKTLENIYSPRAWGCTGSGILHRAEVRLFPTSVGVYRLPSTATNRPLSIPHERGGVPYGGNSQGSVKRYSPRAWGCTDVKGEQSAIVFLFPTSVGVYRGVCTAMVPWYPIPHERGGVPNKER